MQWLFRLAGTLLLLVFLAFAAVFLIPSDRVVRLATERFEATTGRQLVIEGSVKPSLWPVLGVETGRITLSNAPWSEAGPMLEAEGLSIRLDLAALAGGTVRITGLSMIRPEILVERSRDGVLNWDFAAGASEKGGSGGQAATGAEGSDTGSAAPPLSIDRLQMSDGILRYVDHATGQDWRLDALGAEVSLPDYASDLGFDVAGQSGGQTVSAKGTLGRFADAVAGEVVPVDLALRIGTAQVSFAGRVGTQPLAAEGQVDAALGDLSAVAAVLGVAAPELPEGFGSRSVGISGKVTRSGEGDLYLRGGRIVLDDTVLSGDLDLALGGERPRLTGTLATDALLVGSAASGGAGGGGTKGAANPAKREAAAAGWSDAPLSAEGLKAVDADLGLSVDALQMGGLRLSGLRSRVTVDAGRAVVDLGTVAAYGGTLAGSVVVNGRKGLSVGGKLDLTGVALQPLLTDLAGYDRLIGTGDLAFDFVAGGGSMAELMRRLDGSGRLSLTNGEVRGIDIPAMLARLDASQMGPEERTVFDALDAGFTIEKGNLFNEDLTLQSSYLRATGSGRVGIAAQDFDYRLRATALRGEDGTDRIAVPVVITGPWAKPKVALDLEAIAQERLGEQAKAAEDELRRRAAEELGQQEGESLEDAAKRKLQERIEEEAGGLLEQLLGGN